jgi:hypothetical protein
MRKSLVERGFTGWHRFAELRPQLRKIDREAGGVYIVYRDTLDAPTWLAKSSGGTWRGDPAVPRDALKANWVDGARTIYIGKAAHNQLRNRLRAYCSFGEGGKGRHYGGRLIWQLKCSSDLLVAWRIIADRQIDPYDDEQEMIASFRAAYGKPPFANDPHLLGS